MKVLWVIAAFVSTASVSRADTPLTIDAAIRLALTGNERAAIADLEVVVADAAVARARTGFLPIVTASANDTLRPRAGTRNTAQAQLSVSQPLFDPTAFPVLAQARHARAAQRARTADDKRRLAFDTAKAFMTVLLADQLVQAAQRKLDTATANLASTDAQVKAQLVSSNDVTRARISLAGAAREVAADRGRLAAAHVELGFIINQPITGDLAPPAALLEAGQQAQAPADQLAAASLARRPDLAASRQTGLAARDSAREARMRYLPELALGAQVSATTDPPSSGHALDTQIALTATWTVFDSGGRAADARARDAQVKIADLETAALARAIASEVGTAAVQLAGAQQALAAARDARDASRKSADEAAILYRQGLAKAIELLDANEQRFIAEVNYATSEFDVVTAYLALRLAMGLDPLEVTP